MTEDSSSLAAVVLAAGQGTRMRSSMAKVLHPVLGRPMLAHVLDAARSAGADRLAVVVGHQAEAVRSNLSSLFGGVDLHTPLQAEQLGTGHAVQCAASATEGFDELLILCGDTPNLNAATLHTLRVAHASSGADVTVVTFEVPDPTGYGRMIRGQDGALTEIVEHRDATEDQRAICEVNAGVYLGDRDLIVAALSKVGTANAQGEVYLTDIVSVLAGEGHRVLAHILDDPQRVAGVNTREQLSILEQRMLSDRLQSLMSEGVSLEDPSGVRIETTASVGADTTLATGVQLLGTTSIGAGCRISAGCVLTDCTIGDGVHLKPYVVAEGAIIGDGATAGPFTHLRPGTVLGEASKVGNFVETKKATLGKGAKASHLSYLGDCEVGDGSNIGAGTITCNYDGSYKHKTVIGKEVFIGSDTQLVAPVNIGDRATVGAGTTVTVDVPPGSLVVTRGERRVIEGYDARHRQPREAKRAAEKAAAKKEQ
ncbi:MAG: bifunctional UDP-N-acetylglucosamine diphosphorylase/glucosamine-1-phosphate N-acetyltransferase GlmU [Myxococcota bacterium]